jgi:Putative MetA-pathway of phenol degradation
LIVISLQVMSPSSSQEQLNLCHRLANLIAEKAGLHYLHCMPKILDSTAGPPATKEYNVDDPRSEEWFFKCRFGSNGRCRSSFTRYIILGSLFIGIVSLARGQTTSSSGSGVAAGTPAKQIDRSQYNLFNPTPSGEMRDFMPDRPSVTDGPYTVDPGHWLLEVGLFEYTRDRYNSDGVRLDSFATGDMNIRLGLTSYAEMDFLFTAYTTTLTTDKQTGIHLRQSGFSDFTLRSKINIFGDDGGFLAIGLIPFLTLPSGADGIGDRGFAGGVGLPVQFTLPADFQLGMESTVQTIHEPGGGSHFDYLNSVSLTHPITKKLSTYVEFATDIGTAHSSWIGTVDTALIYQPANNWEVDAGVNIGVTKAANDLFTFVGAAWRY